MYKTIIYSALAITLGACSSGSSDDATVPTDTMADAVVTGGNNDPTDESVGNQETVTQPGDTGNSSSSGVTQFGIINLEVIDTVEFEATFFSVPQTIASSTLIEQFRPGADTCEVSNVDLNAVVEIPDFEITVEGFNVTTISAGEVLTISSAAGSYTELIRNQQFGFTAYSMDDESELSAPAPSNLSISIPGDEFAAFTNIALPAIEPLQVSSPGVLEAITASTTFGWTGSTNPNSFIEIYVVGRSADNSSLVTIDCEVVDDGSFAFSTTTQEEIGTFSATGFIERYTIGIEQQGNSVLFLSTLSERVN